MVKFTAIMKFLRRVYLTFRLWRMVLISIVILSIPLGTNLLFFITGINLLFFLPSPMLWTLVAAYLLLVEIMVFGIVKLVIGSAGLTVSNFLYNRKHKPEKIFLPHAKEIARKLGIEYNKPICITDNPSITGPFTNLFTGEIWFPRSLMGKFHRTENEAIFGHEAAHIKYGRRFLVELLVVSVATIVFAQLLGLFTTVLMMLLIAEFAVMMLLFSPVLRRNEFRADWEGGKATSPEALISVLEYFQATCKRDEGWITHPPYHERIKRLKLQFNSNRSSEDNSSGKNQENEPE